jgi:broad specificity phosphatase PhoE
MRIYLIRHGQTYNNTQNRVTGQGDDQLTDVGRDQADILGRWMSEIMGMEIDTFYASNLSRAVDTATIVAGYYDDAPVTADYRFQERFLADLTGHQKPLPKDRLSFPDVESDEEVVARCHSGMLNLLEKHADQTVCVVAHG